MENYVAHLMQQGQERSANRAEAEAELQRESGNWMTNNVVNPMVNGSGLLQVYDTLAGKEAQTLVTDKASLGSGKWLAQTVSGAVGAIVPYVVAGKVMGAGLNAASTRLGIEGAAAKAITSEGAAQILGAGAYDALKKPLTGETRVGNAVGTMAGFSVFTGGNALVGKLLPAIESAGGQTALKVVGRLGVGAAGGATSYEVANKVAGGTGGINQANSEGLVHALASGALINAGLPAAHEGLNKVINLSKQGAINPFEKLTTPQPARMALHLAEQFQIPEGAAKIEARDKVAEVVEGGKTGEVKPFDAKTFGNSDKLGATVTESGVNFAVASKGAGKVELLLYDNAADSKPSQVHTMFKSGDIWHYNVEGLKAGAPYHFRASGAYDPAGDGSRISNQKLLIDPYARAVSKESIPVDNSQLGYDNSNPTDVNRHLRVSTVDSSAEMPKAIVVDSRFDWQGVEKPHIAPEDEVVYELNVRGYTAADGTLGTMSGTYRGLIEKIPHLKSLGVTTVELMPIMQGDRAPWFGKDPVTGEPLLDSWNYNTVAYQAPDASLAHDGKYGQQVTEFKEMVREFHRNDMEVVLDIVFNHTREANQYGPTISFKGLDNQTYYMTVPGHPEVYVDHTGCGNTVNTNHPQVSGLIMDTLRYWVQEMQVDGFRFDLGSVFKYDVDGQAKYKPPIIAAIENDPVLAKSKLVSEPWGTDRYDFGNFSEKRWAELNGPFRDTVRSFVKSDPGQTGNLANLIKGSPNLFDRSQGRFPINMVTNHDGFTLNDVVSYNDKHNERNGEQNRDGSSNNFSWNGGVEGPVENANLPPEQKAAIEALRERQIKNLFSFLFLSRGTPMMLYGDEMRRTTGGNNNTWNQDRLNALDWSLKDKNADMVRFTQMMIALRKSHEIGRSSPDDFVWHGTEPFKPDFSDYARFIAWQLKPSTDGVKPLYSAFNSYWEPLTVKLPPGNWHRLVDTNLPGGQDIVAPDKAPAISDTYVVQPRSGIVLEGR